MLARHEQAPCTSRRLRAPRATWAWSSSPAPGATNTVTGIATAHMDMPLVVITARCRAASSARTRSGVRHRGHHHAGGGWLPLQSTDELRLRSARRSTSPRPAAPAPCSSTCRATSPARSWRSRTPTR
ncbi:MAG: hypothetical protein ACLTMP_12935 [Eggerthella lenta]